MSTPKIYARRAGDIQPKYRDPDIDLKNTKIRLFMQMKQVVQFQEM